MKKILRFIPVLLAVIAVAAGLIFPASAAVCPTFIVEASKTAPVKGDEITVTVSVQGTSDLAFGVIQLAYTYDASKLELLEQTENSAFVQTSDRLLFTKAFDSQTGNYVNYIFATPGQCVFAEKTTLFTMRFKVLTDTAGVIEQSLRHVVTLDVNSETVYSPLDKYVADAGIVQTKLVVPPKTGSISGSLSAYHPASAATIQLLQNGEIKYTQSLETLSGSGKFTQSFSLSAVAEGTYDLVITKAGHLAYTVSGVVVAPDSTVTLPLAQLELLCGDVNGDNVINQADIKCLRACYGTSTDPRYDLNGDGVCNVLDVAIARANLGQSTGA